MKKYYLLGILSFIVWHICYAQWPSNKENPIFVANTSQHETIEGMVEDGSGGVYVCWKSSGTNIESNLLVAHYNAAGTLEFALPVQTSPETDYEVYSGMVSDGSGGVIVVWYDQRSFLQQTNIDFDCCQQEFFGQHFSANGTYQWTPSGKLLASPISNPDYDRLGKSKVIGGNNGEFFLAWEQLGTCKNGSCPNKVKSIKVERFGSDGVSVWPASATVYSSDGQSQSFNFDIVFDAATDQLFCAWEDARNSTSGSGYSGAEFGFETETQTLTNLDIFAQSLDVTSGERLWSLSGDFDTGIPINTTVDDSHSINLRSSPKVTLDNNTLLITWIVYQADDQTAIFASKRSKTSGVKNVLYPGQGLKIDDVYAYETVKSPFPPYTPNNLKKNTPQYDVSLISAGTYAVAYPAQGGLTMRRLDTSAAPNLTAPQVVSMPSQFAVQPKFLMVSDGIYLGWHTYEWQPIYNISIVVNYFRSTINWLQKLDSEGTLNWNAPLEVNQATLYKSTQEDRYSGNFFLASNASGVYLGWGDNRNILSPVGKDVLLTKISNSGKFTGGITLQAGVDSAPKGTQVSIPITVKDFSDVLTLQASISWNPAVVAFQSVTDFGIPGLYQGSFGLSNTSTGLLSFSWDDEALNGVDLDDNAVLFKINFELTGNPGDYTEIAFLSQPVAIEAYYEYGLEAANIKTIPGLVEINAYQLSLKAEYFANQDLNSDPNPIADANILFNDQIVTTTNEEGQVNLLLEPDGDVRSISVSKSDLSTSSVDVADIIVTRDHILSNQTFDSPLQYIAADADQNNSISTVDIALIRGLILGRWSDFNGRTWIFANNSPHIPYGERFSVDPPNFSYLNELLIDLSNAQPLPEDGVIKFAGVKLGDVNGSWVGETNPSGRTRESGALVLNAIAETVDLNQVVNFFGDINDIAGLQFTIEWNPELSSYVGIESDLNLHVNDDYVAEGKLSILWYADTNDSSLTSDDLFRLILRPTETIPSSIAITSSLTKAIAYDKNLNSRSISMSSSAEDPYAATAFFPNPFSNDLFAEFQTLDGDRVTIEFFDELGRVTMSSESTFSTGKQFEKIETNRLSKGLHIVKITFNNSEYKIFKLVKH